MLRQRSAKNPVRRTDKRGLTGAFASATLYGRCAQPQLFLVKYKHLAKGSGEPEGALVTLAQEKERVTTRTVRSGETDQHLS